MNVLRAAIGILGLALLGLVLWAGFAMQDLHGSFLDQFEVITTLPWAIATLAALAACVVLAFTLIFLTEKSWLIAVLWAAPVLGSLIFFAVIVLLTAPDRFLPPVWAAPTFVIGGVWAALWFVVRLPHLAKQLSKPDWPAS